MKLVLSLFVLGVLFLTPILAQSIASPDVSTSNGTALDPQNPATWLGLKPEEAYRLLGAPAEISAIDDGAGHLHVIHYYPNFTYLFWFDNHVWQVRLDERYTGEFFGLHMGMSSDAASTILTKTLGKPVGTGADWSIWSLPYQNFQRRLKLIWANNKLVDAFFFRSDL